MSVALIDPYPEWGEEALEWVRRKAEVYEIAGFKFLVEKGRATFTPLSFGLGCIKAMLPAMAWVAKDRDEAFDLMLPASMREVLPGSSGSVCPYGTRPTSRTCWCSEKTLLSLFLF